MIEKELLREKIRSTGALLQESVMGSSITSIGVGGPVDYLISVQREEELISVLEILRELKVPHFPLGSGTNLIIRDKGFRGAMVRAAGGLKNYFIEEEKEEILARCFSGAPLFSLVKELAEKGAMGAECLAGIPGTVGGAVRGNAGTRKGSIGAFVREVTIINSKGKKTNYLGSSLKWEYRKVNLPESGFIFSVILSFPRNDPEKILKSLREELDYRNSTQPVGKKTCGCIFKNPRDIKKSAGEIIEELGFKGVRIKGARVSEVHANFIENDGNAEAKDVLVLIKAIQEKVKEKFGITLEREVVIIGEE